MTAEKVQFENPFTALFSKVDNVEKLLISLSENLAASGDTPSNPNERLTRIQVRQEFNISLGTIHNLMKRNELPYEKVGRKTLFKRQDVEKFFSNKKRGGKI